MKEQRKKKDLMRRIADYLQSQNISPDDYSWKQICHLYEKMCHWRSEHDEKKLALKETRARCKELKARLEACSEKRNQELQAKLQQLQSKIGAQEQKLAAEQAANDESLEKHLSDIERARLEAEEHKLQSQRALDSQKDASTKLFASQNEVNALERELATMIGARDQIQLRANSLQSALDNLEKDHKSLREKCEVQENTLTTSIREITDECNGFARKYNDLKEQNAVYKVKIEQLTKEKDEEINRREQMLKDIKASHADSIAWANKEHEKLLSMYLNLFV